VQNDPEAVAFIRQFFPETGAHDAAEDGRSAVERFQARGRVHRAGRIVPEVRMVDVSDIDAAAARRADRGLRAVAAPQAFPSVAHLGLYQATTMLEQADALVAEAAKPNDYETGRMHDDLQYRMLKFAADSLRREIKEKFGIGIEEPAPGGPGMRP